MTAAEAIDNALELIKNEKHWCRGELALNKHNGQVRATSKEAVSWCAAGALMRATHYGTWNEVHPTLAKELRRAYDKAFNKLNEIVGKGENHRSSRYWTFMDYNDSRSHIEVIALFKQASEELHAEEDQATAEAKASYPGV